MQQKNNSARLRLMIRSDMIDIEGGMVMAEKEMQVLERIARQMADIPGHTGFYYKNLITG